MASSEGESLESLLNKATNPSNAEEDWDAIMNFCDQVNKELEGPQISVRLLAHKIQSPQEREALYALITLESCVKNCGKRFHQEIGKFRFLNEMIKVVSPKYLGNHTTEKVKNRVIEILYSWTEGLQQEAKITEAYSMLKRQGIVTADPVHVNKTFIPPAPPRKGDALFEDNDKSKLLAKLLKSKHPEDLQAANRLIKNMVKQDAERMDKVSKRTSELETVNNNVKLLQEMLNHYNPDYSSSGEKDLMKELYENLEKQRPNLFRLASDTDDKDNDGINEILKANDEVMRVMTLYKKQVQGVSEENGVENKGANPSSLLDLDSPNSKPSQSLGSGDVSFLDDDLTALGGTNMAGLDSSKKEAEVSLPSTQAVSNDLEMLSDLFSSIPTNTAPPVAGFGVLNMPMNQGYPVMGASQPPAFPAMAQAMPTLQPIGLTPQVLNQQVPAQNTQTQKAVVGGFDDLDILGQSLAEKGISQDVKGFQSGPIPKVSMNQMQQKPASPTPLIQPQPVTAVAATSSSPFGTPKKSQQPQPLMPTTATLQSLAGVSPISTPPSSVTASPMRTATVPGVMPPASKPLASTEILPLTDVHVPLETIQPGSLQPLTAYDKNGMKISIHFAKDTPRPDVLVMVVSIMSTNTSPVKSVTFQAAVPKLMKVKLQPPSATDLPAFNPILPPAAITQVMLLANPHKEKIRLKFKLSYIMEEKTLSDVGEVDTFPVQ